MENLDLIIMTIIVSAVFAIFSISFLRGIGPEDGIKNSKMRTNNVVSKDELS
jgi:hypothetical protein